MTAEAFRKAYAPDWRRMTNKPVFVAFMSVLEDESLLKKLDKKTDGERLNGAVVYLNHLAGEQEVVKLIRSLAEEITESPEPADSFSEPETI